MTDKKPKSSAAFWLGCLAVCFVFALLVVGGTMLWMLRRENTRPDVVAPVPAGWRDSIRAWGRVPAEAVALAPPRTDSGNAAELLHELPRSSWPWITLRKLELGRPLDAEDSQVVARVRVDTTIDIVARAARMRSYAATAPVLERSLQRNALFDVAIPSLWAMPDARSRADLLAVRARLRAAGGQSAAALDDFRAVLGLDVMIMERSPSWSGVREARRNIGRTARALADLVAVRRDTATAHAVARLVAAVGDDRGGMGWLWFRLAQHPDSAFAAVADTTLPFGFRAQILLDAAMGSFQRSATRAILGPDRATVRRVRSFEASSDRELAAVALAADSVLVRVDRVGYWRRLRALLKAAEH